MTTLGIALFALGVAIIAYAVTRMVLRERRARPPVIPLQRVPPAQLPGAGRLHARAADGSRLCDQAGGLATTHWTVVDCDACLRELGAA